jgi:hypothetical protein
MSNLDPVTDFDTMVFDVYRVRPDTDAAVYERWLNAVDVPVFADREMVAGYYCCKVIQTHGKLPAYSHDAEEAFTHFGQIGLVGDNAYGRMMTDPVIQAHVPVWISQWSVNPDATDMASNFSFNMAKRRYADGGSRTRKLVLVLYDRHGVSPGTQAIDHWAGAGALAVREAVGTNRYESWEIVENLLGHYGPNGVDIIYSDDDRVFDVVKLHASIAVQGMIVAGPN